MSVKKSSHKVFNNVLDSDWLSIGLENKALNTQNTLVEETM